MCYGAPHATTRPEVAFHAALRLASAGPRPLDPVLRAHLHTRLGRLEMIESRYEEAAAAFDAAEVLLGADAGRVDRPMTRLPASGLSS